MKAAAEWETKTREQPSRKELAAYIRSAVESGLFPKVEGNKIHQNCWSYWSPQNDEATMGAEIAAFQNGLKAWQPYRYPMALADAKALLNPIGAAAAGAAAGAAAAAAAGDSDPAAAAAAAGAAAAARHVPPSIEACAQAAALVQAEPVQFSPAAAVAVAANEARERAEALRLAATTFGKGSRKEGGGGMLG